MTTLADLMDHGTIPPSHAVKIIVGICEQLAPAQKAGRVRQTLTPETVTVDPDTLTVIELADRTIPDFEHRAPETWPDGAHRHGAAEVYALGAILTQLISGEWPPAGLDRMVWGLRALTERMLSVDPSDRPTTKEVHDALTAMPALQDLR